MAEELYRFMPWLQNVTGREKGVSGDQQHKNLKDRIAEHLIKAGVERPAGATLTGLADIRGSKTPGSAIPADTNAGEGVAMDSAGKGKGYPEGVVRPMDYTKDPGKVQPSTGSGSDERTSSEGVVQKGLTLGGVNKILKGFGAGELADVSTTYLSEARPATLAGVTQLEKPLVDGANPTQKPDVSQPFQQDPQLQASFPEGTKPFASTDSYTPYSTGGNSEDPQDGSSSEPDRVERIRQVAFQPKGARQKEVASRKSVRGNFGGDEPDNSTLVSPTQSNPMRNQIRDIYGDTSLSIAQQSAKVSALTGVYRYGGEGYANVDGELVPSKVGSGRSLLNARGAGLDPTEFLQTKVAEVKEAAKTDTTSETPTTTTEVETPDIDISTFKPAWKTTAVPDSGAPAGGWDKHFADMEKNR